MCYFGHSNPLLIDWLHDCRCVTGLFCTVYLQHFSAKLTLISQLLIITIEQKQNTFILRLFLQDKLDELAPQQSAVLDFHVAARRCCSPSHLSRLVYNNIIIYIIYTNNNHNNTTTIIIIITTSTTVFMCFLISSSSRTYIKTITCYANTNWKVISAFELHNEPRQTTSIKTTGTDMQ